MISWHRVGQRVAVLEGPAAWLDCFGAVKQGPQVDEVCTIVGLYATPMTPRDLVGFILLEYGTEIAFDCREFRPVYPEIVDKLHKLSAPSPTHAKENA